MRYLTAVVIVIAASVACSREPAQRTAATLTGPSSVTAADSTIGLGGVSGPMAVDFPAASDPRQFRLDLDFKYQTGLQRPATTTYVDLEGDVVWVQEYIRYRVNGCDHATAVQRIIAQIDGGAAGGGCSSEPVGLIAFPSRADVVDFRRTLETKYQQMGRGLRTTYVDLEGAVIWITEYLRYRVNGCTHDTAVAKVFAQIDGGPVSDTCYVACNWRVTPDTVTTGVGVLNSTFELRPDPVACEYTLTSEASWLTFPSEHRTGRGFTHVPYSVAQNLGNTDRTGRIRVTWETGSATFTVQQTASPYSVSFTLVDGFRSVNTTNQCHVRSTSTPCTFTGSTNLPGNNVTFTWAAFYSYGTLEKVVRQSSTSNVFVVSDACGGAGSSASGEEYPLTVELRVEDDRGNVVTIRSGEGAQSSLLMKMFSCGT